MIRPATPADAAAIAALWNPIIRQSTVTFSSEEKTEADLALMCSARPAFVVAQVEGQLMGLATYAQFRGGNGYAHAAEHTIILAPKARGRGIGRALLAAVEADARAKGFHVMVAAVCDENAEGISFHAACGYVETGRMPEVGRKFGRWLGLVLMQKLL